MSSSEVPNFTLRQLAYFVAAAEHGTIASAAERLHVSPSAMSDAISELEATFGEQLCIRRRAQGVTLTPAGAALANRARRVLAEVEELQHTIGEASGTDGLVGPLVIGSYPTLAPTVLPVLLQDFAALHPQLDISFREATQDQLSEDLRSGRIDIAFVYDTLVPDHAERAKLYELQPYALFATHHALARNRTVRLEDLVHEDLILLDTRPSTEHTLSLFSERSLTPLIRHRTSSYEVVRTLVARGVGYGILVSHVENQSSYEGLPLVTRPISPAPSPVAVDVIWSAERPLSARARALIQFAREVAWPA